MFLKSPFSGRIHISIMTAYPCPLGFDISTLQDFVLFGFFSISSMSFVILDDAIIVGLCLGISLTKLSVDVEESS